MTHAVFRDAYSLNYLVFNQRSANMRSWIFFTLFSVIAVFGAPKRGSSITDLRPRWNSLNQFLTTHTVSQNAIIFQAEIHIKHVSNFDPVYIVINNLNRDVNVVCFHSNNLCIIHISLVKLFLICLCVQNQQTWTRCISNLVTHFVFILIFSLQINCCNHSC